MNAAQYTITHKATGENYAVTSMSFGQEVVEVTTEEVGTTVFSNIGSEGNLLNDEYTIQEAIVSEGETGALPVENVVDVPTE